MRFLKIIILLSLILVGCGKGQDASSKLPLVLVSIGPYKFIAEKIVGDAVEVRPVVPLLANPHAFEPTSRQVGEIAGAAVWFRIGEPFEEKVVELMKEKNREMIVYDLRSNIPLLEESCHGCCHSHTDHFDRHIWMNPKLALLQAEAMTQILAARFPEKRDVFEENFEILKGELTALNLEILEILGPMKDRTILVSHPAFGYFCKEYAIEQLSVEHEGKDPRPKHLEDLVLQVKTKGAEFAIALPQHNNKGAQLVAERLHLPVRLIDPYSTDYFEMMRTLAHLIANPGYQP